MTFLNSASKKALIVGGAAIGMLALAPSAMAAPQISADAAKTAPQTSETVKLAERDSRDRNRGQRSRDGRRNRDGHGSRGRSHDRRGHNSNRRSHDRRNHHSDRRRHDSRRHGYNRGHNNRYRSSTHRYQRPVRHTGIRHYRPAKRHAKRHYRTNYRSGLGISFHIGTPGYSRYRWAPSNYGLYRSAYGPYSNYTAGTYCQRVVIEGWHYNYRRPISVVQCSNAWDGTYIVQGTERLA